MEGFLYLVPLSLGLGAMGLGVFLWTLHKGQYEDLDGAAERILHEEDAPVPESDSVPRQTETKGTVHCDCPGSSR